MRCVRERAHIAYRLEARLHSQAEAHVWRKAFRVRTSLATVPRVKAAGLNQAWSDSALGRLACD